MTAAVKETVRLGGGGDTATKHGRPNPKLASCGLLHVRNVTPGPGTASHQRESQDESLHAVRSRPVAPFVRVQHIDVSRAPLDKLFGTATLVIHTAGTHNNVVVVPGLAPDRADSLRSMIRATIRSDLG